MTNTKALEALDRIEADSREWRPAEPDDIAEVRAALDALCDEMEWVGNALWFKGLHIGVIEEVPNGEWLYFGYFGDGIDGRSSTETEARAALEAAARACIRGE